MNPKPNLLSFDVSNIALWISLKQIFVFYCSIKRTLSSSKHSTSLQDNGNFKEKEHAVDSSFTIATKSRHKKDVMIARFASFKSARVKKWCGCAPKRILRKLKTLGSKQHRVTTIFSQHQTSRRHTSVSFCCTLHCCLIQFLVIYVFNYLNFLSCCPLNKCVKNWKTQNL